MSTRASPFGMLAERILLKRSKPSTCSRRTHGSSSRELVSKNRRADVSAAWRKIGIKTIESVVGAVPPGLAAIATNPLWIAGLGVVAGGLILKAAQGSIAEADAIRRGNTILRASPLFAFDNLVTLGKTELKKAESAK